MSKIEIHYTDLTLEQLYRLRALLESLGDDYTVELKVVDKYLSNKHPPVVNPGISMKVKPTPNAGNPHFNASDICLTPGCENHIATVDNLCYPCWLDTRQRKH